ncbi:MAG: N-acetylmuramoyl-L-alanine amidase [Microbacter sp.]
MKSAFFIFLLASVVASAQPLHMVDYTQKVHFGVRPCPNRKIDIIVIHSSYNRGQDSFSVAGIIDEYRHERVAAHYLIDRKGVVYRLVPENDVAFHAGKSTLPSTHRTNLNTTSIGIELINTPTVPPDQQQYQSLTALILEIKKRHPIAYIVGHKEIAPKRKTDPWLFDWEKLREMMRAEQK